MRVGCHIFIDGELLGGDVEHKLMYAGAEQSREILDGGFGRFFLKILFSVGLPIAIITTVLNTPETFSEILIKIVSMSGLIGILA